MTFTKRFTATSSGVILGLDEGKVPQIMTKKIAQVDPDAGIEKYMDIMGKHRVRHLPVVEKGKVVGVITSTDVLILTVNEQDNIIEQLERYISPGGY